MAINLVQTFESNLELNQLKAIILNNDFHELRNKETKLINYKISSEPLKLTIKKVLEIDLPSNISAIVSNPFEIIETWNLEKEDSVTITVEIPKIQSIILVELLKSSTNEIQINSEIKSKVFMMGSFVEEHVAKFWKKLIEKDSQLLIQWPINQI